MMRFMIAMAGALLISAASAQAQQYQPNYGSAYDWQTGNSYNWSQSPGGSTTVNGFNASNGTIWRQTVQPNGNQSGWDSRGNMWNYNAATKTYMNYGTGRTCINGTCF